MTEPVRFKIAEAARMAGVSASTLRLWESQGLIEPVRSETGQRLYEDAHINQLKKISWLRNEKGINPAAIRESLGTADAIPSATPKPSRRSTGQKVGPKVRRLRHDAGETLEKVSQDTGIAVSMLSTFERTSQGLSFKALHDLVSHFGTTLAILTGQDANHSGESLVRRGKWPVWPATSSGASVQVLAEGNNMMECNRFVLAPGASSEGAYAHEGEEFLHILSGAMEIVLDQEKFFTLKEGDSFYFESRRPHSWRNVSSSETILIWINTPATF
jgi:DNA-binding transcriptional MerR regulator/mannose-6-phosphate isomerase-like protein (cupin superfamily)